MTDYNDGNWWGWNGGECPVHPETVVDVVVIRQECETWRTLNLNASVFDWDAPDGNSEIIAFRVVRAYREPREFWVADVGLGFMEATPETRGAFKVREVLE